MRHRMFALHYFDEDNIVLTKSIAIKSDQTFDALTSDFRAYLEKIHRKEGTITRYAQLWGRIKK